MSFRNISRDYSTNNVRVGYVKTSVLGDELDSATIIITHTASLELEPYDLVDVSNGTNHDYWLVADYTKTYVNRNSYRKYDYTINLMSVTKLLETVIMPSTAITRRTGKTDRRIYDYINRAFKRYFTDVANKYGKFFIVDSSIINYCNSVCPECTFSQTTLREYLDYLFSFKGCISKLYYDGTRFVLTGYSLNPSNGTFPIDNVDSIVETQSASDYVTELVTEASDIISNGSITEYKMTKNESGIYTSSNANIVLDHKPYDITSLKVKQLENGTYFYGIQGTGIKLYKLNTSTGVYTPYDGVSVARVMLYGGSGTNTVVESQGVKIYLGDKVDITSNLVTQEVYTSLETLEGNTYFQTSYLVSSNLYKNNTICWNRGSHTITNLNYFETSAGFIKIDDLAAIEHAYVNSYLRRSSNLNGRYKSDGTQFSSSFYQLPSTATHDGNILYVVIDTNYTTMASATAYQYDQAKFEVTYTPYVDFKISQLQDNYTHLVAQANNTTNSLTDVKSFYDLAKAKNNMLGNEALTFTGHSSSDDYVFSVGMRYSVGSDSYVITKVESTLQNNSIQYKGTLTKNYANRDVQTILNREKRYYSLPSTASVTRHEIMRVEADLDVSALNRVAVYVDNVYKATIPAVNTQLDNGLYALTFNPVDNVSIVNRLTDKDVYGMEDAKVIDFVSYCDSYGEATNIIFMFYAGTNELYDNYEYAPSTNRVRCDLNSYFLKDGREKIVFTAIIKDSR